MVDDLELLERWRGGDNTAGNQLFQRCFAPIYRFFVNKTRNPADTEELTQNTFVALVSARDQFLGRSRFLTYALGIANNVLRHYYRELSRSGELSDPLESSIVALGAGARTQLECAETQQLLLEGLREIPAEFQIVLELYYVESFDLASIADTLGLNPNTVRSRLSRGRKHLRAKVEELAARTERPIPLSDDPEPDDETIVGTSRAAAPASAADTRDTWRELIKGAFPARVLSSSFRRGAP